MKSVRLLLLFFTLIPASLAAQVNGSGSPVVISVDAMETPGEARNWCITMDNRGVMYFGNQNNGVVTFDGLQWKLIPLNRQQRINALATDYRGVVYVAGTGDFGFLQPDRKGDLKFESFADRITDSFEGSSIQPVLSIAADSSKVYFAERSKLWIYDFLSDTLNYIDMNQGFNLRNAGNVIAVDNRVFIADNRKGIFEYKAGLPSLLPGGDLVRSVKFISLLPLGRDQLLVVTRENGVYLYNYITGKVNTEFLSDPVNSRLKESIVSAAAIIPGNRIAIGVENGEGIFIFDLNGVMQQQIPAETSQVPGSAVISMFCDYATNSQLWFCTPGNIHRAYVSLPVSGFDSRSGINARPEDLSDFNGVIYISCDSGLYRSHVTAEGRFQFSLLEGFGRKTVDLQKIKIPDRELLIASTPSGLFQVDTSGVVKMVYTNLYPSVIRVDRDDPSVIVAGSVRGIVSRLKYSNDRFVQLSASKPSDMEGSVVTLEQSPEKEWWVLTESPTSLYRIGSTSSSTSYIKYGRESGLMSDTLNYIVTVNGKFYVCSGNGIYRYDTDNDLFEKDIDLIGETFRNTGILKIMKTPEGDLFIAGRDTRYFDALVTRTSRGHVVFRKQFDILPDKATTDIEYINGNIWIIKGNSLYVIDKSRLGYNYGSFCTVFTNIIAGDDRVLMNGSFYSDAVNGIKIPALNQPAGDPPRLKYAKNNISFSWTTTSYVGEEKTEYRYKLEGFDSDWSKWEKRNLKEYTNLPPGKYHFKLRSLTMTGLESKETVFSFSVLKPWYRSFIALLIYVLLTGLMLFSIIRFFTRRLRIKNIYLEKLVRKQAAEVNRKKEELETGLQYAVRVQTALLPDEKPLADATANYFIFYRPRELAGGDFFWISRKGERLFVAVADCTGHGVQGASLSVMGISFLNEIIKKPAFHKADQILTEFRGKVIASLKQPADAEPRNDSIKMALLVIDYGNGVVEFSGAYNPCFRVRPLDPDETTQWETGQFVSEEGALTNGKYLLETVGANKIPIGISNKQEQEYTQQEWELGKEDSYYLFTDGYTDQFNGLTGKKFLKKNFKRLLLDVQDFSMARQKTILEERLQSWMGSSPQVDDILIIGFKP